MTVSQPPKFRPHPSRRPNNNPAFPLPQRPVFDRNRVVDALGDFPDDIFFRNPENRSTFFQKVDDDENDQNRPAEAADEYGELHPDNDYPEERTQSVYNDERELSDEEDRSEGLFMVGPSESGFPTGICYDTFEYEIAAGEEEED
jgi:hypothetical protein